VCLILVSFVDVEGYRNVKSITFEIVTNVIGTHSL